MEKEGMPPPYDSQQAYPPPGGPSPQGQGYPPPQQGYPPPQQGYPPQQGAPPQQYPPQQHTQSTVVVAQPVQPVVVAQVFREAPVQTTCGKCGASIVTATQYETGTLTWIIAGVLCLFMIWPCCLIPFCVDGCKDVIHKCPNCQQTVGVYRRLN